MISRSPLAASRSRRFFGTVALASLAVTGCSDAAGYDLDYILSMTPFVGTMRRNVAFDPQEMPRLPAPNTVPVASPAMEVLPAFTQLQLDSVGAALTNPFPVTPELLARGETVYQNNCFVCHGANGEGNGPVVGPGKYPLGPSLVAGTALARSPGYVYGIVRVGRGLMPAYSRLNHSDRWAVAAYVQQLQQQSGGAAPPAAAAPATVAPAAPAPAPAAAPDSAASGATGI